MSVPEGSSRRKLEYYEREPRYFRFELPVFHKGRDRILYRTKTRFLLQNPKQSLSLFISELVGDELILWSEILFNKQKYFTRCDVLRWEGERIGREETG